jgi:glycosyltransferase involved in cell wall biosynthesis
MRIALFLECPHNGTGEFQQALSTVEGLTRPGAMVHDVVVFTPFEQTRQLVSQHGFETVRFKQWGLGFLDRLSTTVLGGAILRRMRRFGLRRLGRHLDALLDDYGAELVVLTDQSGDAACRIGDHAFITTVWDTAHRDHPDFPEVYTNRTFEHRERIFGTTLVRALAVIVDSPSLARRLASLYQVDPNRIIELPFLPSLAVRRHAAGSGRATADGVRRKYGLPARFVFYPAYPAVDKNHLYLLTGLVDLERRHGIILHAVFCGGGEPVKWAMVKRQTQALGLTARAHFLGTVPDDDVPALYEAAFVLVMPTDAGPTNLPPLEAIALDCPVIYSDIPEFREQMGDAALYCDLADASSLADHLAALVQDTALRDHLRAAGCRLAAEIAKIDYSEMLKPVIDDFAYLRRRWAWPEKSQ